MFIGEYHYNLDEKGRITIPSKFREELGNEFIITRGLDNCLFVYTKKEWEKQLSSYNNLPNTKDSRKFLRIFLSGAIYCTIDKQGRTNLTAHLMNYAGLTKETVIIGVGDHIEIWDNNQWQIFMNDLKNITDIAENLFKENNNA